jgi:hypothetical protein
MIVQTKVAGGSSGIDEHTVEVPAHHCTLRELLEVLVRHELSEYERRREVNRTLRILTPTDLVMGVETGSYGRERRAVPKGPPVEEAHARAVEAFGDGLYFVFLDGRQIEDLDVPLEISPESRLRLVRLVALAGA